ncbi:MAG: type VI secretion system baseplate subunit TssF [Planctomycetota bacterium]
MDRRLVRYYERELRYIRESAAEFAKDYPKIAGRLALDEFECADPYVERLLEGFAFLTARVQLKLDAEFPRFTRHLLDSIFPQLLCPVPSMCVVTMSPDLEDPGLAEGPAVARGSSLKSNIGRTEQTACEYRTAHDIRLWPIEVEAASYHDRDLGSLDLPAGTRPAAAIRLRLRVTAGLNAADLAIDRLPFFLRGSGDIPVRLYEAIFGHASEILVRAPRKPKTPPSDPARLKPTNHLRQPGFSDDEALLPVTARGFEAYRNIHEYFAFHQRFTFVEFTDLKDAFAAVPGSDVEIIVLLDEPDFELETAVDAQTFVPHCTPAINLFPKRADRVQVSDRSHEFHVVPDRTRPLDFEVYDVVEVTGYGARADDERAFRPLYQARADDHDTGGGKAFFSASREPRQLGERERRVGRRSSYAGSEVFLSLVDAVEAPFASGLRQLAVTTRCTNRDLPLRMPVGQGRTDFTIESGASLESIRVVAGPTPPRASPADGDALWRLISHLNLNYLSLIDAERTLGAGHADGKSHEAGQARGATAMRDMLSLYADTLDASARKQIDGLRSVRSTPISRRVPVRGPVTFARGLEVAVEFEEGYYEGVGCFMLGAVLERFLAKYVSVNSFTETVVSTRERGEIMRWPTRIGRRHLL